MLRPILDSRLPIGTQARNCPYLTGLPLHGISRLHDDKELEIQKALQCLKDFWDPFFISMIMQSTAFQFTRAISLTHVVLLDSAIPRNHDIAPTSADTALIKFNPSNKTHLSSDSKQLLIDVPCLVVCGGLSRTPIRHYSYARQLVWLWSIGSAQANSTASLSHHITTQHPK